MFPSPRVECASVEQTIFTPGRERVAHVAGGEIEPVREPVHLDRHARLQRDLEDLLEIERVLRPVVEDPALRVRETARSRMAHRLEHALRERLPAPALARVEADLHPVELREHVVREVERAVRQDVGLDPAEQPERRQPLVRRCDLLALAAHAVRVEARHDATAVVWSQIARYS